jgi:hypothetical protein
MRRILLLSLAGSALVGCKDSNVPFLTAPTTIPNSPAGIQNAVTGLISGSRNDIQSYMIDATGFARDGADYTNTEPRLVTYELGLDPISPAWASTWTFSYANILQSHQIIATIPQIVPALSNAQAAALTGVVQTLEAYNYMIVAEDHDSLGIAILPAQTTGTTPPPAVCFKNGWQYITALLDSANANLQTGGGGALPIRLPDGFSAVSASASAFASFNRALAGKAYLELAYAIARSPGGSRPTPTTSGSPDNAALIAADNALALSAPLLDTTRLTTNSPGGFTPDGHSVLHNFSAKSGDNVNPMNTLFGTFRILNTIPSSQDTVNDARWKAKFAITNAAPQQQSYDSVVSPYIYMMYASTDSYIPIVRNEELALVRAQVQLGLGNYAAAAGYINSVRVKVGKLAPAAIGVDYVSTRDALLHEQQISTAVESSGDRMIAIRMYNLAAQLDTTWRAKDLHTTVDPIPFAETTARGGTFNTTCH